MEQENKLVLNEDGQLIDKEKIDQAIGLILEATKLNQPGYNYALVKISEILFLRGIGHPENDPNITETPDRVAKLYKTTLGGYFLDHKKYLKTFPNPNGLNSSEPVIVSGIEFNSYCSHHKAQFLGKMTIAYVPGEKVLGLSKVVRIMRVYAKRLQLQEQLTKQVAEAIMDPLLGAKGVAVFATAKHLCMSTRGVRTHDAPTNTDERLGVFHHTAMWGERLFGMVERAHYANTKDLIAY